MTICKNNFKDYLHAIKQCYAKSTYGKLPDYQDFPDLIFDTKGCLNEQALASLTDKGYDNYFLSVVYRIIAVNNIQKSRDQQEEFDIKSIFELISLSINSIESSDSICSIGSQGFLSIPIYKNDADIHLFEFIRLHIWDNKLDDLIDKDKCDDFAIHNHMFHGHSWTIIGKIINQIYNVEETKKDSNFSLFTIGYNDSLNEINQHTSIAKNSGINVNVNLSKDEILSVGESYEIEAGTYHKSGSASVNGLSATFFSFTAINGLKKNSYVVGPKNIQKSEINRKMQIDATDLLNKIKSELNERR